MLFRILQCCFLAMSLELCRAEKCEEVTDLDLKHSIAGVALRVRLLLFTHFNPTCGQLISSDNPFSNPLLNASRPTTFIIHGYRPTGSPPIWMQDIVKSVLDRVDAHVIVVDWNRGATNINYLKAVENTRGVAASLTAFIEKLKNEGASLSSIHMIGISLGAHISGFIGASFNGAIGRITALDPAGPAFTGKSESDRLDPLDAQFVDVLHTDMDAFGFRKTLGHIDFYANGGADQPGCPKSIFSGSEYFKCDHQRSVFLYLDALRKKSNIIAYPCSNYADFQDGKCLSCKQFESAGCPVFGYDAIGWKKILVQLGNTTTYFTTNKESPFGMTNYKVDIMTWNSKPRWGYITITLKNGDQKGVAEINHKSFKFEKYIKTSLLAQFNRDVQPAEKIILRYSTENTCASRYKLRVLRFRLTPLESSQRPLCRYDLVLEENKDVEFRPVPCEDSNF